MAQYLAFRRRFERANSPHRDEASVNEAALNEFAVAWESPLSVVPGKEAIAAINQRLQSDFGVSLTPTAIIDAMTREEFPIAVNELLAGLAKFASSRVGKTSSA